MDRPLSAKKESVRAQLGGFEKTYSAAAASVAGGARARAAVSVSLHICGVLVAVRLVLSEEDLFGLVLV
jgi:hypothetical protein